MKNFYELVAINPQMLVVHTVVKITGFGTAVVQLNDKTLLLSESMMYLNILEPLKFQITVSGGCTAEVLKFTIDSVDVLRYQHLATPPGTAVTSTWCIDIPEPFYRWYHRVSGQGWLLTPKN